MKYSKGGFTANWNRCARSHRDLATHRDERLAPARRRRFFALIGSSLFYAESAEKLTVRPKLFTELADVEAPPDCYARGRMRRARAHGEGLTGSPLAGRRFTWSTPTRPSLAPTSSHCASPSSRVGAR